MFLIAYDKFKVTFEEYGPLFFIPTTKIELFSNQFVRSLRGKLIFGVFFDIRFWDGGGSFVILDDKLIRLGALIDVEEERRVGVWLWRLGVEFLLDGRFFWGCGHGSRQKIL